MSPASKLLFNADPVIDDCRRSRCETRRRIDRKLAGVNSSSGVMALPYKCPVYRPPSFLHPVSPGLCAITCPPTLLWLQRRRLCTLICECREVMSLAYLTVEASLVDNWIFTATTSKSCIMFRDLDSHSSASRVPLRLCTDLSR